MASPSILLVDNDDDNRLMYAEYLRSQGLNVVLATATDDALKRSTAAAMIVTGIRLAGSFDGIELVRRIRLCAQTARTSRSSS